MTLQSLIGMRVRSGDQRRLGRIFGFRGERSGPDILVTHVRIGVAAWLEMLWPHRWVRRLWTRHAPLELPWEAISRVDREVELRPEWDEARCREHPLR
jgi:hypothetical protein